MKWVPILRESRRQAFIDLARKAVAHQPDLPSTREALATLLLATGEYDEAVQTLSKAVIMFPTEPKLRLMLADAYLQKSEAALAWRVLQQTPIPEGEDARLSIDRLTLSLRILKRLEAFDDAAGVAADLLGLDATNGTALRYLADFLRKKGDPESMVHLCRAALARQPGHTIAYYELALTFAIVGRCDEAREMMDLHQFVSVYDVTTPCSYQNAAAFERALAAEIKSDETLKWDPPRTATEGGFHTDYYLPHSDAQVSICGLISLVQSQVDQFAAELAREPGSPFVERRPEQARLNAWAVVHPSNGRQMPHIHPKGWLSGVYYVSTPKRLVEGERAGCLALGEVDEELNINPPWGVRDICPAPGRLVLFPSYLPHATIPSGSVDPRICVAFDVIPCA